MKFTTFAQDLKQLEIIKESNLDEVILSHKSFSRMGRLTSDEFNQMAKYAQELFLEVIFEWDILMTQKVFDKTISLLNEIQWPYVDKIRLQDPGALQYCMENFPDKKIQFICENGNHNLLGLKTWQNYIGERLDRLIISAELPKTTLMTYCHELDCELELLGLGKILLFYTPRNLLSPLVSNKEEVMEATGASEESPHKGFPIVENIHGTFMFHIKDQYLLDYIDELTQMGMSYLRLDLRDCDFRLLEKIKKNQLEEFKVSYHRPLMKGFYRTNKTDVLFPKLKNNRLQLRDEKYLGEVVDVAKKDFLVLELKPFNRILKVGDEITLVNPEGKKTQTKIEKLLTTNQQKIMEANAGLVLVNYQRGFHVKSQVYFS